MEELERTFLAKQLPLNLSKFSFEQYLDIYVPTNQKHPILRIRKKGKKYEITKKELIEANDKTRHLESTIFLTTSEYKYLSNLKGKRISKKRYYYREKGINYEIDLFEGKLKGLVLVDVEFTNKKDLKVYKYPNWLLTEVTEEEKLAGGMLCGKSYSQISKVLKSYNYTKLKY